MGNRRGFDLTVDGIKCLSVTTGGRPDGTHEIYVHALDGQRHLHGWAKLSSEGVILNGGGRVKNRAQEYLGPGVTLSHSTQELARVVIQRGPTGATCKLKQSVPGRGWLETGSADLRSRVRRPKVKLAAPTNSEWTRAEYTILAYDARSVPPNSSPQTLLQFSTGVPFGLIVQPASTSSQ